jgi:DNA-directed RNA polymerase specialized sigma24 family protein
MLEFYLDIKQKSEGKINQLQGLNYQITRMKYMENKTYKQIADELGKSYGFIESGTSQFVKETQGS